MGEHFLTYNNTTRPSFSQGVRRDSTLFTSERMTMLSAIFASFGLFCNGLFVGWSSGYSDMLLEWHSKTDIVRIIATFALGAALSVLCVPKIWYKIGTKIIVLFSCFLMMVAWTMLTFNEWYWLLLTGRILGGIGVGAIHLLVPVYIQDILPNEQRPLFDLILSSQFVLGILTQFALGYFKQFMVSSMFSIVAPTFYLISFLLLPESPRYLYIIKQTNAANSVLIRFKDIDEDVEDDVRNWCKSINPAYTDTIRVMFRANLLFPTFSLVIFEQLMGAIPIIFYLERLFVLTNGNYSPNTTAIICVLAFAMSLPIADILGCKSKKVESNFWISTILCMTVCLSIVGIFCHYRGTYKHGNEYEQIPLLCVSLYFFFYAIGPYKLTWTFIQKITPAENYFTIRSMLIGTSWLTIYAITRILPSLIAKIGAGWLFWYMGAMCLFNIIAVLMAVVKLKKQPEECKLVETPSMTSSESSSVRDV